MPNRHVIPLRSLTDLLDSTNWTVLVEVYFIEGLKDIKRTKSQVFNFNVKDASGTICVVEAWNELATVCSKLLKENMKLHISGGDIKEDTFSHKYRQANHDFRIRLKKGSELSRVDTDVNLLEKIVTVNCLKSLVAQNKVQDKDKTDLILHRYCFKANIIKTSHGNALYKTCRMDQCKNKDNFPFGSEILCNDCANPSDLCGWTYRVVLHLEDDGSLITATIFGTQAEKMFRKHPEEAHEIKQNKVEYETIFKSVGGKEAVFRVRPHLRNGKLEFTVCNFYYI